MAGVTIILWVVMLCLEWIVWIVLKTIFALTAIYGILQALLNKSTDLGDSDEQSRRTE